MSGYTFSEWFATGVALLMIAIVVVVLGRCVLKMKRSPRDE